MLPQDYPTLYPAARLGRVNAHHLTESSVPLLDCSIISALMW